MEILYIVVSGPRFFATVAGIHFDLRMKILLCKSLGY